MYWIPLFLIAFLIVGAEFFLNRNWIKVAIVVVSLFVITLTTVGIDYWAQVTDTEVWSGEVSDWKHHEEWEEWHPPVEHCSTDSKGHSHCHTTPGYYEHHPAENFIKTTDNGWIYESHAPDGIRFNDSYPNNIEPLKKYWKRGTPTASTHTYVNKVNASYSIYRHKEIDLKQYPNLPEYPIKVRDKINVDRLIGDVPNKTKAQERLAYQNSYLNQLVKDKENPDKMTARKQVNMIFVNVGADKPKDYGFALQDYWQGGNKNDFIVAFSMKKDGTINWVYPFSWSESELLKIDVREYFLNLKQVKDFAPVVDDVSKMVEQKYERKQFKDFDYLHIRTSTTALVIIWVFDIIALIVSVLLGVMELKERNNRRTRYRI